MRIFSSAVGIGPSVAAMLSRKCQACTARCADARHVPESGPLAYTPPRDIPLGKRDARSRVVVKQFANIITMSALPPTEQPNPNDQGSDANKPGPADSASTQPEVAEMDTTPDQPPEETWDDIPEEIMELDTDDILTRIRLIDNDIKVRLLSRRC